MGYTHYWTREGDFTDEEWKDVRRDVRMICATAKVGGIVLRDGMGEGDEPVWQGAEHGGEELLLNGDGMEGLDHETFWLSQKAPREGEGHLPFCKTARKPYDAVVVAILCYLETVWSGRCRASSDGDEDEWKDGLALARRALPERAAELAVPKGVKMGG